VDGAKQIDGGLGMSTPKNRAMALSGVKKSPKQPSKLKNSAEILVKSLGLKHNGQITHLAVSYSDLP
jgi:hypothetical protein